MAKYCRSSQATVTKWRMRVACWIPTAINTHSECVILTPFPLQQLLHELASMLRYMHIASVVGSDEQL